MVVGYLDASSGSMVVGAIAAAGAGVAVAAKVGWRRMAGALTGKNKDGTETEASATDAPETDDAPGAESAESDVTAGTTEPNA
jgi:hypothetical protein